MLIRLPHELVYDLRERPDAEEVAASILSNRRLMYEAALLLKILHPGLKIEHARIELVSASQNSPLREIFLAVIVLTFQEDIQRDVPKIITDLTGMQVPEYYETLISFLVLTIAYYGIGAAINIVRNSVNGRLCTSRTQSIGAF